MAKPPITQPSQRRSLNPRDQFGRLWHTNIEIATGDATGGIIPAGWSDPLNTPTHYIRVPRTDDGQMQLGTVEVDFPRWIHDHEAEEERWFTQLYQNAHSIYKTLDQSEVKNLVHDKYMTDITGPKPFPSVEVLKKAQQGYRPFLGLEPLSAEDRAMLGKRTLGDLLAPAPTDVPEAPPENYQEFIGWAIRGKHAKNLGDAAALWKTHTANLVAG